MTDFAREKYINPYTNFGFKKLFKQAEIARYTPEERREYEASLKGYWDYFSTMKTAEQKGEKKKAKEIARNLKAMGLSNEQIAKGTGLSSEEIEKL